jgi:myo-inositol-1(or 4)-monophosphatase
MMTLRDTWEWDVAAGALIAERAGATVTDRSGAPLRFNAPKPQVGGVLAAPGALHRALRARMTNG